MIIFPSYMTIYFTKTIQKITNF